MPKPELSIVIVSFNTKELLRHCLLSLKKERNDINYEVMVVDNASSDGSSQMVNNKFPWVKLIKSTKNIGFGAGNNLAKHYVNGKYILFLNSDTTIPKYTLKKTVNYMNSHKQVGALTCKIILPSGEIYKDTRRSFITPWTGLVHLFLRLDRIFPESKYFARYWYGYIPDYLEHEVDVIQGAFFLTRKKLLDELGWFDEDYFLDGEDVDLCWRIKQKGWNIVYYPKISITHFKGASKGKVESVRKKDIPLRSKLKFRMAGVDSMEIFYKKRLWNQYPLLMNFLVLFGIKAIKTQRLLRTI